MLRSTLMPGGSRFCAGWLPLPGTNERWVWALTSPGITQEWLKSSISVSVGNSLNLVSTPMSAMRSPSMSRHALAAAGAPVPSIRDLHLTSLNNCASYWIDIRNLGRQFHAKYFFSGGDGHEARAC